MCVCARVHACVCVCARFKVVAVHADTYNIFRVRTEFLNFVAEGYRRKLNHSENFPIYGILFNT